MNPANQWSAGEAASVNEFLNSPVGRKWLGVLFNRKPRMDLASTDRAAMTGAFAAGYEFFFSAIAETRTSSIPEDPGVKPIDSTKD